MSGNGGAIKAKGVSVPPIKPEGAVGEQKAAVASAPAAAAQTPRAGDGAARRPMMAGGGMGGGGMGGGGMNAGGFGGEPGGRRVMSSLGKSHLAGLSAAISARQKDPKSRQILAKLDEPIAMPFVNEAPLEDVLKYIRTATTTPNFSGIPIYVDPIGLQEAEKTTTSPVTMDLEGVPLKITLKLMLKQLGLAYCVRDGVLIISDFQGILTELQEAASEADEQTYPRQGPFPQGVLRGGGMGGFGGGMGGQGGMM
jgi:hypothetical protein